MGATCLSKAAGVRKIVIAEIERAGTQDPLSTERVEDTLKAEGYTERPIKNLLKLLKAERRDDGRFIIEPQNELTHNAKRELVKKPRGATYLFTPDLKDAYLRRWGVGNV